MDKFFRSILCALCLFASSAFAVEILVTHRMDVMDGDGLCSLREAIRTARLNFPTTNQPGECPVGEASPAIDTIKFAFSGTIVIDPNLGPLPALADGNTIIDGWSAPGAGPGILPTVLIDGSQLSSGNGIQLISPRNFVRGLTIVGFPEAGIRINGQPASANWIYGNIIGADAMGQSSEANFRGVAIDNAGQYNLIGTNSDGLRDKAEKNLISGNTNTGILVWYTPKTKIAGNRIGTNLDGTTAIPNGYGIDVYGGQQTVIGTNGDGTGDNDESNLVSGNTYHGVSIYFSRMNRISGNLIGTDVSGNHALPNQIGVNVHLSRDDLVGTDSNSPSPVEGNIISGNNFAGLRASDATDLVVAGNRIGIDYLGNNAVPNLSNGIMITGSDATIGGETFYEGNVLSGNEGSGIFVNNGGTYEIRCNMVGTDRFGSNPVPNTGEGVYLRDGSGSLTDNRIRFNLGTGIQSTTPDWQAHNNVISNNESEGYNATGSAPGTHNVSGNWWGDPSGPQHNPGNTNGLGDQIIDYDPNVTVSYPGWLTTPTPYCSF